MTNTNDIQAGCIVRGPTLPEPIEVLATVPMGDALKVIGRGTQTGMTHDPVLTPTQLADLIVNRLNAPNPFGTAEIEALRESGRVEREQQRRAQTAALEADAARRGVFFGTPLTTGLGEMEAAIQRSADQTERDILQLVAEATERSSQATLDDALQFLGMAGNEQQAMNQLAVAAAQLGQQGGIDPNSALALLMGMGGDAGGIDPNLLAFFGSLFGAPQTETG